MVLTGLLCIDGAIVDVQRSRHIEAFWDFVGLLLSKTTVGIWSNMAISKLDELLLCILPKDLIALLFFIKGCDIPGKLDKYSNRCELFTYLFNKNAMRKSLRNLTIVFTNVDLLNQKQNSIIPPIVHIRDTWPTILK